MITDQQIQAAAIESEGTAHMRTAFDRGAKWMRTQMQSEISRIAGEAFEAGSTINTSAIPEADKEAYVKSCKSLYLKAQPYSNPNVPIWGDKSEPITLNPEGK